MNDVKAKNELPACPVETTLTLIGDKWKVLMSASAFSVWLCSCWTGTVC